MTPPVLSELTASGVGLWLDDLNRSRLEGGLLELVSTRAIRGVTSNPTIFEKAISAGGDAYAEQLTELRAAGTDVDSAIQAITTDDVRAACDQLIPIWEASGGRDGRVSIEVDPRLAHDAVGTAVQARELWSIVDRPNAMIKIPATKAGLPAISETLAAGISVNVTLIFSIDRYREVLAAHAAGITQAIDAGHDPAQIESVASFFVSRVDTAVDAHLDTMDSEQARELRGQAAIANARLAWRAYTDHSAGDEWRRLSSRGARPQRPLWASTGVKDPAYDPSRYVVDLAAPGCVNTVPEATLHAVAEGGTFAGDTVSGRDAEAQRVMEGLASIGVDIGAVCADLESAGVASFIDSWESLRTTVERALDAD